VLTDIPMLPARKLYCAGVERGLVLFATSADMPLLSHMDLCRCYVSTTAMCVLIQSLALVSVLLPAGFDLSCALMVCLCTGVSASCQECRLHVQLMFLFLLFFTRDCGGMGGVGLYGRSLVGGESSVVLFLLRGS
jgi:ribose/xylose/arabinose/galactoside ABC-type transport system permease subunit